MTREQASELLQLPASATPAQRDERYDTLLRQFEDKLAKAPTPGLREKYRVNLDDLKQAHALLAQTDDGANLPVLQKQSSATANPPATQPIPAPKPTASSNKGSDKTRTEFLLVALAALVVLAAGAWWVVKTHADNAEKTRLAGDVKAADDARVAADKAALEHKAVEEKRLAEAGKAEQERKDRLTGQLRGELAGFKVRWEALEKEESNAERRLSELKSNLRSLRDPAPGDLAEVQALAAAQQNYYDWLSNTLARHPAKVTKSKADELLSARQPDAAATAMDELRTAIPELEALIPRQKRQLTSVHGRLRLALAETVAWTITDAFGQIRNGEGGGDIDGLAVGHAKIQLRMAYWPDRQASVVIRNDQAGEYSTTYQPRSIDLASTPAGATVLGIDGKEIGKTPLRIELPPGKWPVTLKLDGYVKQKVELPTDTATTPKTVTLQKALEKPKRWLSPEKIRIEGPVLIEEWDVSQPDAKLGPTQIVRNFVDYKVPLSRNDAKSYPKPGSVLHQHRQPDGQWKGKFVQGKAPP